MIRNLLVVSALLFAGCIGHVFAAPLIAYAEAEDALCRAHLPGEVDPTDGGFIYVCRRSHGAAHYELIAFPAPGGVIDIPGDETRENGDCGVKPSRFGGSCIYECEWPEGWSSQTQEAVPCDGVDAGQSPGSSTLSQ